MGFWGKLLKNVRRRTLKEKFPPHPPPLEVKPFYPHPPRWPTPRPPMLKSMENIPAFKKIPQESPPVQEVGDVVLRRHLVEDAEEVLHVECFCTLCFPAKWC